MTTSSANNSVFRAHSKKQKTTEPNFKDWYRQLSSYCLGVKNSVCPVQAEQELLQTTRDFHACKPGRRAVQLAPPWQTHNRPKTTPPALHAIRAVKSEKGHWKRNCPQYLAELLKKKKNTASGASGSGIFAIELNTFLNRSWIYDTGCGTHICNTTQGLRASRKLNPVDLSFVQWQWST
ncbi:hypothetical protein Tco_0943730 [Tanacetum coccineum]